MRFTTLLCLGLIGAFVLAAASRHDLKKGFERPARIAFPEDESYSPQRAALGKMLFFDARLSGALNMSCATCHNPSFGWETPAAHAVGAMNQPLKRHTPTIENLTESQYFFWDGRIGSLKEQIRGPITHPLKMNSSMRQVMRRLENISGYRRYFEIAFPEAGLTEDTILVALATYQRTLRSGWSPFDDWIDGDDDAISGSAKRGFDVFSGRGQCVSCHRGWAFTDHEFHSVGLDDDDIGRGILDPQMKHRFKTPGLRNIALRAPYMHNGSLSSLRMVVEHYRRGGERQAPANDIQPLDDMTDRDVNDLIAFLETLTAYNPHVSAPALPAD